MKRIFFCALLLLVPLVSVLATEVIVNSTTMPYFHEDSIVGEDCNDAHCQTYLALYQFMDGAFYDTEVKGLDFYVSAWGRLDALDQEEFDKKEMKPVGTGDADLDTAYVRWSHQDGLLDTSLGRKFVRVGPVARRIDGLEATVRPVPWVGLQAFGGVPTVSSVGFREGDWGYGGRLFGGYEPYFQIGVSYADFLEEGDWDMRRVGGDLRVSPIGQLDVFAHAYFDLLYNLWYDMNASVIARPVTDLELFAAYEHVTPSAFFGMSSIFSVFTYETMDKVTGRARYVILKRVKLEAEFNHYQYEERDPVNRYGGSVTGYWNASESSAGAGVYRMDREDKDDYWEVRAHVRQQIPGNVYVALDGTGTLFEEEIHEEDMAYYGTFSLGWDALDSLNIQGSAIYLDTPVYDEHVRGLLKITYEFNKIF